MQTSRLLVRCFLLGERQMCSYTECLKKIGNREVVGFGYNGNPTYIDRTDLPMPAIRFKEVTPDVQALREKEKGDWKQMSIEDKKALYRASFCQTFAEMDAPSGEWKSIFGWSLIIISVAVWTFVAMRIYVYPPLPITFDKEHREAIYDRLIIQNAEPITGMSAYKWQDPK